VLVYNLVGLLRIHHCDFEMRVRTIIEAGQREDGAGVIHDQDVRFAFAYGGVEQLVVADL